MSSTVLSAAASSSAACITAIPDKNGHVPVNDCRALYNYYPSFALAIVFSVIFGISLVLHTVQAYKWRKKFCWVVIMAVIWEMAAFVLRTLSTRHQTNNAFFLPSFLLIFLAPLWFNAFDYMLLGRMIYFYLPSQSIFGILATSLTKIFVLVDIVSFLVQVTGGVMASGGPGQSQSSINRGLNIYMGGIGLQQFAILVFLTLVVKTHLELLRLEREGVLAEAGKERGWKKLVYALYASLTFITIRIVFRLIEFSPAGNSSGIPNHEAFLYCFDAIPMAFAAYLFNCIHPGQILVGPDSEFPKKSRKQKKEEKREKKEAKVAEKKEKRALKEAKKLDKEGKQSGLLMTSGNFGTEVV